MVIDVQNHFCSSSFIASDGSFQKKEVFCYSDGVRCDL